MRTSLFQNTPSISQTTDEDKSFQPLISLLEKPFNGSNITKSLDELFPEQQSEEKNIKKAKEILGVNSNEFTTEQLRDIVTEMQYLVQISLDNFEKGIFEGVTLKELLHEKSI